MIFLHGVFLEHAFYVWAETEAEEKSDPEIWPYAANENQFREVIEKIGIRSGDRTSLTGWFPSLKNSALPSSPLFGDLPANPDAAMLRPWKIPALLLNPEIATEFLKIEDNKIETALFYGNDVLYWSQVLRFILHLMRNSKLLPWLENSEARWIPVLTGGDQAAFAELARSMPPLCRSFSREALRLPPNS